MFESFKIINKANKFLKRYNIPLIAGINVYKKLEFIHCKIYDWRGPIELEDFPVLSIDKAVEVLIEHSLFEYYVSEEVKIRHNLIELYPSNGGDYDCRKYFFEQILKMFKLYDEKVFKNKINKYTRLINTNRHPKNEWKYNTDLLKFEC